MEDCKHGLPVSQCGFCNAQRVEEPRCRMCGRVLQDSISIEVGAGPICFEQDTIAQGKLMARFKDLYTDADRRKTINLPDREPITVELRLRSQRMGPVGATTANQWADAIARTMGHLVESVSTHEMSDGHYIYVEPRQGMQP
jgi:hypothetical protein